MNSNVTDRGSWEFGSGRSDRLKTLIVTDRAALGVVRKGPNQTHLDTRSFFAVRHWVIDWSATASWIIFILSIAFIVIVLVVRTTKPQIVQQMGWLWL